MIKNRDIVIIGLQPWDVPIGSNCKDIALEMSKHNRVLYVNYPMDVKTVMYNYRRPEMKKRLRMLLKRGPNVSPVQENLWMFFPKLVLLSANWISWEKGFKFCTKINNALFASQIKKAVQALNFKNIILFNDNDIFRGYYMKEMMKPSVSVYYSRDFLVAVPYWKKHGAKLEPELIAKSDLCVANSIHLRDYCKKFNKQSFYVGQGCDLSLYQGGQSQHQTEELRHLGSPIIGYVGAVTALRLNIDWIKQGAIKNPEWSWVLVGPAEDDCIRQLSGIANIHMIGPKPPETLPGYIASFDVCINPQIISEMTIGNYPRKVDEYLAMQKPVVATRTKAMSVFEDVVYLAHDLESFLRCIRQAMAEDSADLRRQRRAFAESHSWENSVNEIYKAINETVDQSDRVAAMR